MSEQPDTPTPQSSAQPAGQGAPPTPPALAGGGASPVAAAAFAAGIVYMWAEMIFRYAFTHSPGFNSDYFLWNGRPGDVAAMWLTILSLEVVVFFALAWLWRGRARVGSLFVWTIALAVSAVAAPMLGELGTPATGTIGPHTTDLIAWIVTAVAVVLGAAALAWPRFASSQSKGAAAHRDRP